MSNPRIKVAAAAVFLIDAAAIVSFWYYRHDPSAGGAPQCLFRLLTGYECPGCGAQRALHAIVHGHLAQAWNFNPFIFFAVPAAAFYIVAEAGRELGPRFHARVIRPVILVGILIAVIGWWILRNI